MRATISRVCSGWMTVLLMATFAGIYIKSRILIPTIPATPNKAARGLRQSTRRKVSKSKTPKRRDLRTAKRSQSPTAGPTFFETSPTLKPTSSPTARPTVLETSIPTREPTASPTKAPSVPPTRRPTSQPSTTATSRPTVRPTSVPSFVPTLPPHVPPTFGPSIMPTTELPTIEPTSAPSPSQQCDVSLSIECFQNGRACPSHIPSSSPVQIVWTARNQAPNTVSIASVHFETYVMMFTEKLENDVPDHLSTNVLAAGGATASASMDYRLDAIRWTGGFYVMFAIKAEAPTGVTCAQVIGPLNYVVV